MADEIDPTQRQRMDASADRGAAAIRKAFGTERQDPSTDEQAVSLARSVKNAHTQYQATEGDERTAWRNIALDYHRQLVALVGEQEAAQLEGDAIVPEQPNSATDEPGLTDWQAYFSGNAVKFNAGTEKQPIWITKKFDELPQETQQEIIRQAEQIYSVTGNQDPFDILDSFNAGLGGPSPQVLANMATVRQEQQRQKNEENAQKAAAAAQREAWRQRFAEEQAKAKQARQEKLDEERRKAREKEAQEREAGRRQALIDRQAQQAAQQGRQGARDAQAQADRTAREQAQQQNKQAAYQRALDNANKRRREIALATAQRAATVLARTQVTLEHTPMPGGIGLMLIAIIFILFAIQPVNASGATRLQLMFEAFMGNVKLPTDTEDWQSGIADALGSGFAAGFKNVTGLNATASSTKSNTSSLTKQTAAGGAGVFPGLETQYGGVPGDMSLQLEMPYSLQSIHEAF